MVCVVVLVSGNEVYNVYIAVGPEARPESYTASEKGELPMTGRTEDACNPPLHFELTCRGSVGCRFVMNVLGYRTDPLDDQNVKRKLANAQGNIDLHKSRKPF